MAGSKTDAIQKAVETKLKKLLEPGAVITDKTDLQVLSLGIKYLAVKAKLGEEDWGKDLDEEGDEV